MAILEEWQEKEFIEAFNSNPKVIRKKQEVSNAIKKRDFVSLARLQAELRMWEETARRNLADEWAYNISSMSTVATKMTESDMNRLVEDLNILYVLSDILDICSMEVNELLQKYEPTCKYREFEDIVKLGDMCRKKISFMSKLTTMDFQVAFGDASDDLTSMVRNKVRSLITKMKAKEKQNRRKVS